MADWGDTNFSAAYANQTVYDEEPGSPSWVAFKSSLFQFSPNRDIEDVPVASPGDMLAPERVIGSAHGGTLGFSVPLRGQAAAYDPSSAGPVETPEITFLKESIGAKTTGTYVASDIAASGSAANVWEVTAATPAPGDCYLVAAGATGALKSAGWVKSVSGTTVTLFEDGYAVPASGDHIIPCITLYPDGTTQPTPKVMRQTGPDATHDYRVVGWMPTGVTINAPPGKRPTIDVQGVVGSEQKFYTSAGGALAPTAYLKLPPIMREFQGRLWINGASDSDGSAETRGTCGVGGFTINIGVETRVKRCHGGGQGVSNVTVVRRTVQATFSIPYSSDWVTGTQSVWDDSLVNGTTFSLSLMSGSQIGRFFGMLMPSAVVAAVSPWQTSEGVLGWNVTFEPHNDGYSGDGSSSGAGNSPFRLAFG